jgi:hypothetical protein
MVGSLKMNTTLEYSTRVVQEGDRRCKKSTTLNDLAYLTPIRIPLMTQYMCDIADCHVHHIYICTREFIFFPYAALNHASSKFIFDLSFNNNNRHTAIIMEY